MNIKEYLDILKDLWTPTNASKIRMSISNALEMMGNNLEENIDRQDNVENQFQDVLDETTGKDVINGPEIIAARNGETNLKARLDKEKNEVAAQLAQSDQLFSRKENNLINDIRPNGVRRPLAFLIDDDGHDLSFTILKDILEPLNVPIGMALVPNGANIGYPQITDEHIQEALDLGWEFGSHTVNHPNLTTLTEEELHFELGESKRLIEKRTGQNVEWLAYPGNRENELVRKVARKYYKYAFLGRNRPVAYPARAYNLERVSMGAYQDLSDAPDTLEWYKEKVDDAIAENKMLCFMLHAYHSDFDSVQQQHLKDLINYIRSKNVEIVKPSEAYAEMGNLLAIGDGDFDKRVITNTGEIIGSQNHIDSTTLGLNTDASGDRATAIGYGATASGASSISIGDSSTSSGRTSTAVGTSSKATGLNSSAFGRNSKAENERDTALGYGATASGGNSTSVGDSSNATGKTSTALGVNSVASGEDSLALGRNARAIGMGSVAIGRHALADRDHDFILGSAENKIIIPSNALYLKSPNGTTKKMTVNNDNTINIVDAL